MPTAIRLLLVDDNPHDRALVARELSHEFPAVEIRDACDEVSLAALLAESQFDLVITDYHLRWSNGLHVLAAVKASQPNCPVIMFTGTGTEQLAVEAMKAGLDDYVVKTPKHFVRLRASAKSAVERAASMARLSVIEASLSSLLSRLKVGVFLCEMNGRMRTANEAFQRLLLVVAPTTAVEYSFRDFFHDKALFDDQVRQVQLSRGPVEFEAELRNSANVSMWADIQLSCLTESNGIDVILGILTDATARKLAAETQHRQQSELAHMGRLTTMGELAAGLAHEVNQPLGAIANYAGACLPTLETADFPDADNVRNWIAIISEQALRAGSIIRSISRFLDRHEPARERLSLNQIIHESLELIGIDVRRTKTTVVCEIADASVFVDGVLIQQVFVNLVRNAIESMQDNEANRRSLRIIAVETEGWVEIEIHDQGPGIAPELVDTLFKPFVTSKANGLGMGLAVCTRIVESHGGRLSARSSADGTVFQFTLPTAIPGA